MRYDRDEVLARTDLPQLCEELLGPPKGRGRSATWPCPAPGHGPQTGKSPPVSVFTTRWGEQRWRCHACGAGGTALDLVMTTQHMGFRQAIETLARRAGVDHQPEPVTLRPARIERPKPLGPGEASPEIERHVAACEAFLWSHRGVPMQRWLAHRGLFEDVLRANRIGADPGPALMPRAKGLPRAGAAIVLPVLADDGHAIYLQARYLRPNSRRYDNPAADLVGPSPRVAETRLPLPARAEHLVLICEGLPDALTAAQAGYRAVAVMGAGIPDEHLATHLAERFRTEQLVVAFDADERGQAGGDRLTALLEDGGATGRVSRLDVPSRWGDLNGWLQGTFGRFESELDRAINALAEPAGVEPAALEPAAAADIGLAPEPAGIDFGP